MNPITKMTMVAIVAISFAACNDAETKTKTVNEQTAAAAEGHQHIYSCPMHPEVTGKEGDTCPKCGMKLEHTDVAPGAAGAYFMQFATNPTQVQPNQNVELSLTPKKKDAEGEAVALDIEHEKKIHLILVSDDLSWFDHIHPEYTADGSYKVPAKFPAPGKYKAFADYRPTGAGHVVDKIDIDVQGAAPAAKTYNAEKLSGTSGAYSFSLEPAGGGLKSGAASSLSGVVKKEGKEIDANTLDNYLGAKAHFVVISLNEKEYLHVHPSVAKGRFDLQTTFTKPGIYRGWVQFNAEGKLHTVDLTLKVE